MYCFVSIDDCVDIADDDDLDGALGAVKYDCIDGAEKYDVTDGADDDDTDGADDDDCVDIKDDSSSCKNLE